MSGLVEVSIYLPKDGAPSISYTPSPRSLPFESALLVFCLHAARGLVNTSHDRLIDLAVLLINRGTYFISNREFRPQSPARPAKRRVTFQARTGPELTAPLQLHLKGFPYFGRDSTVACADSVGVHLAYLAGEYSSEQEVTYLQNASELLGGAQLSKKLGVRNQAILARTIAANALLPDQEEAVRQLDL